MVKLAPKGHIVIKMYGGNNLNVSNENTNTQENDSPPKDNSETINNPVNTPVIPGGKGINLFADSSIATCFFR